MRPETYRVSRLRLDGTRNSQRPGRRGRTAFWTARYSGRQSRDLAAAGRLDGRDVRRQWRSTIEVNLDSVFSLIRHSVAQMKQQKRIGTGAGGHIVLVSSTAGQRGEAFHVDYAATKGALISMVKGLSTELVHDDLCKLRGSGLGSNRTCPLLYSPIRRQAKPCSTIPLGANGNSGRNSRSHPLFCTN